MKKKRLLAFASVALLAFSALARPLVICADADPDGFDPAQSANAATQAASALKIYDNLVEYAPGPIRFVPALAQQWSISPDGLVYTFNLRHNVKWQTTPWFHPTRDFDAEDVIFTIKRQIDPRNSGANAAPAGFPYALSGDWKDLFKSVDEIDPYTVRITLTRPYAPLLERLAHPALSIVSAEYGTELARAGTPTHIASQPVGTGPYILRRFDPGAAIRYDANPQYYRGKPAIDKLIMVTVPDPAVRVQKLLAGECQLADDIEPQDIARITADPRLAMLPLRIQASSQLFFNVRHKPFDDERVRRALAMAIDRDAIVRSVYGDHAEAANAPYSPRNLWGVDAEAAIKPDIAQARKLLKSAGYPDGFSTQLWIRPGGSMTDPNYPQTAQLIQADWAKIGVKTTLTSMNWLELVNRARAGEAPAMLSGWSGALDPDGFYTSLASCDATRDGYNFAQWCSRAFDAKLAEARTTVAQGDRARQYVAIQHLLAQSVPFTTLAYARPVVVYDRNLLGVAPTANASYRVDVLRWK